MFANRIDAGDRLGRALAHLRDEQPLIVGLPRGGVPVACRVALALDAPLDIILVRKLGVPFQPELAMGAIGEGGTRVVNADVVRATGLGQADLDEVAERETVELERRAGRYRAGRERIAFDGRSVIVVDDGIATGATARAACQVARAQGAKRVILAVPVAPRDWTARLGDVADEFVALDTPPLFRGVGQFYADFAATGDDEVIRCLDQSARRTHGHDDPAADADAGMGRIERDVLLEVDGVDLMGHLVVPPRAEGMVVFAHGAGSSRHSPRNRYVASVLNDAGLATLLFDLLTEDEEQLRARVFDVALLARRLVEVTGWVANQPRLQDLPVGYFGASTGAAAALWAAAQPGVAVAAVVSRGGRPDLAASRLGAVTTPTLLIVGGNDEVVLELNEESAALLGGEKQLVVVPGASHLFEEPGTLALAAAQARDWFRRHLVPTGVPAR